jgi:hypothetical protein
LNTLNTLLCSVEIEDGSGDVSGEFSVAWEAF